MHYSEYPEKIQPNCFYFLRQKDNLRPRVFYSLRILNDEVVGIINFKKEESVKKSELLRFDIKSRLFMFMMRMNTFRNDSNIRKALQKIASTSNTTYLIRSNKIKNTFDCNISQESFEEAYKTFVLMDKKFVPDSEKNSSNIIVPGTKEINMFNLYQIISKNGGMENVTNEQKWKSLFYSAMRKTNVSYTVRTFYKKFLYEFEQYRRAGTVSCSCREPCDCDDYVDCIGKVQESGASRRLEFNYKFMIGEIVKLLTAKEQYYGHVKLRRNRGLNQYYLQFMGWCKEHSEWYCEDVLSKCEQNKDGYVMRRPSRSSKTNNLINDPLIREKHCHIKNSCESNNDGEMHNSNVDSSNSLSTNMHSQADVNNDVSDNETGAINFENNPKIHIADNYDNMMGVFKIRKKEHGSDMYSSKNIDNNWLIRKKNDIDFYESSSKRTPKLPVSKISKEVFLSQTVVCYVRKEKKKLLASETDREFLKEVYKIEGNECFININNYMVIRYFKELK